MGFMTALRNIVFASLLCALLIFSGCTSTRNGRLEGTVNIGPLTPVERAGVPAPPPEVFTSRGIRVFNLLGMVVDEVHFNPDGTFSVKLFPGKYRVELLNTGIEHAAELPAMIHIDSNQITQLNISIDTGIR